MSALRRLQREAIRTQCYKKNGNTQAFKDEWEKVHCGKTDDEVSSIKIRKSEKPKKRHFDDGKAYAKHLKAVKAFIGNMQNKAQSNTNTGAKTKVC